jgi:hypothetical protein
MCFVTFNDSSKEKWSKEDQTGKRSDNFQTFPAEGWTKADGRRLVVTQLIVEKWKTFYYFYHIYPHS